MFTGNNKIFAFTSLWVALTFTASPQTLPDLKFTHITTANGLSSPYIINIIRDTRGLIWICTTDGLNRYDGNSFKVYKQIPGNPNSLPGDFIWDIAEDKKGNFWVGTLTGLCYFEPGSNSFTNYFHEPGNSNSPAHTKAEILLVDEDNNLWVGSLNGLQKFDPVTRQFHLVQFATKDVLQKQVNAQHIYSLYMDRRKQLWVQAGGSLYLLNKHNLTYKKMIGPSESGEGASIYQDTDGQYWLYYWGEGVARYDGIHPPEKRDFITGKSIYNSMSEWKDMNNENWLVITGVNGIAFYNKKNNKLQVFNKDITNPNGLSTNESTVVINDAKNNLWIGTKAGVEMLDPSKQFFTYHNLGEKQDMLSNRYQPIPIHVAKDGRYFWAGLWYANGLVKLDSNWKTVKHYKTIPVNSSEQGAKSIYFFYKDVSGVCWITTDDGLVKFNEAQNRFKLFRPGDIKPSLFEFRKILPLGNNRLLIRTRYNGIYIFNKLKEEFEKHFTATSTDKFPHNHVNDIIYDKKGNLWVATTSGICSIDTSTLKIIDMFSGGENQIKSPASGNCLSLDVDADNNLWIATYGGLVKFSAANKTFVNYTTADGLCNNTIGQLLADKNNNVWMITQNGVSVYMQKENRFQNFYKEDGLPQDSPEGKLLRDNDGVVYLTDAGIIMTINPDAIPFNKNKPAVLITDATLKDTHYTIRVNSKKEKYLETHYRNNSFAVHFAVLNFSSPGLNKYYYKLEGIDDDWHQSDRGIASYINLPPGKYLLRVKGSNNDAVMNEEGDFIRIIISPEWYQAYWFKALCILACGAIIFYFARRHIKTIKKEAAFKQKIAETKMQALRAQMNPHFIFNSLNSIENFIMQNEKRLASDYLNKFSKLIRNILESSRNEVAPIVKDMEALKLYVELEQLRFNNKFSYHSYVDPELLNGDYKVPSLLIQPYVENAIVHGIAHSDKSNLQLTVTAVLDDDKIKYTIRDNGVGRKKAAEYNLRNKPGHKSVGLQITNDRIANFNMQQHVNGDIKITDLYSDDTQPDGTKVEVQIKAL